MQDESLGTSVMFTNMQNADKLKNYLYLEELIMNVTSIQKKKATENI